MILCLRTDSESSYIGIYDNKIEIECKSWIAGRELSVQLLKEIDNCCKQVSIDSNDIEGVVVYKGPGSYTGLRIACSVVNGIGYSNNIPVVGTTGENWITEGMNLIEDTPKFMPVTPFYGGEVHITTPRK